jgi:hypothetical protein
MNKPDFQPPVELIWNKGIAARCDRRIPDEFPNGRDYSPISTQAGSLASSRLPDNLISTPEIFKDVQDGELIWVRLSWVKSFVKQVLPLIENRFVLVTGDSDSCAPSELRSEARAILESPKVVHWFAQNCDRTWPQERISPIPIGIDFHMQAERPIWGEPMSSPSQQERTLLSIQKELPPCADRIQKVYVDFAWQQGWGLRHHRRYHPLKGTKFHESRRRIARKMIKNESAFCQPGPLPRSQMWRERGRYVFVLSPHGMGLDCHRTWEALALGHIVLVPSSSLDTLYSGLSVVALKNWSDINPENLREWLSLCPEVAATSEKLTSDYWIARAKSPVERQGKSGPLENQSLEHSEGEGYRLADIS